MNMQPVAATDVRNWLRWVLRGNAFFSLVVGVDVLIGGTSGVAWMGLAVSEIAIWLFGVLLIASGLLLWWLSGHPTAAMVKAITFLDVAWIVTSSVLLFTPLLPFTTAGKIVILGVTLITGGFAVAQTMGLRRF